MLDRSSIVNYKKGSFKPLRIGPKIDYSLRPKRKGVPVTVCIAARCTVGKDHYIFGAADRMLTAGDVEFEPPLAKIYAFTTSIVAMTAGDASLQTILLHEVYRTVNARVSKEPTNWWFVKDVAEMYYEAYVSEKRKRAENAILKPLGLDTKSFVENQKMLGDDFITSVSQNMAHFDMPEVATIFAGIDPHGAHIYVVDNHGINCYDGVGFAAIGFGSRHAESQFMLAGHSFMASAPETLLLTYTAKKRAEVAPGIGQATDMFLLGPALGSYNPIRNEILTHVHKIYEEQEKGESDVRKKAQNNIVEYVKKLADEAPKQQPQKDKDEPGEVPTPS